MGDTVAGWKALEQALSDGKVCSIGLSNFYPFVQGSVVSTIAALNRALGFYDCRKSVSP